MKNLLTTISLFSLLLCLTNKKIQAQYPAKEDTALVIGYELSKRYLAGTQEVFIKIPIARKCKLKISGGYSDSQLQAQEIKGIQTRVTGKFAKVGLTKNVVSERRHATDFTLSGMFIQYKDRAIVHVGENFYGGWPIKSVSLGAENRTWGIESTIDWEMKVVAGFHLGFSARLSMFNNTGGFNDMEEKTGLSNFTYEMKYIPGIGHVRNALDIGFAMNVLYKIAWKK